MIKRENRLIKHQNGVVDAEIVHAGFRTTSMVRTIIAEISDRATSKRRKIGQLHRFKPVHGRANTFDEVFDGHRGMGYQKRSDAQKGLVAILSPPSTLTGRRTSILSSFRNADTGVRKSAMTDL